MSVNKRTRRLPKNTLPLYVMFANRIYNNENEIIYPPESYNNDY